MAADQTRIVAEVSALLDAQRHALRAGDFAALGPIGTRMEALFARVEATAGQTRHDLVALKRQAEANGHLLEAARRGVQAARTRFGAIVEAGSQLRTYDDRGRTASVSFDAATMERRA